MRLTTFLAFFSYLLPGVACSYPSKTHEKHCYVNSKVRLNANEVVDLTKPNAMEQSHIYVECVEGQLVCFRAELADLPAEEIACPQKLMQQVFNKKNKPTRRLGVQVKFKVNRWPGGYVCYGYTTNTFTTRQLRLVEKSIDHISKRTNVRFLSVSDCKQRIATKSLPKDTCNQCQGFVVITKNQQKRGCYSYVGMIGRPQVLVLNDPCFFSHNYTAFVNEGAVATHELGHAIGLFHEHQHRDRSVIILWGNIKPNSVSNFSPVDAYAEYTSYNKYSIMHYSEYIANLPMAFSRRVLCEPLDQCTASQKRLRSADGSPKCIEKGIKICTYNQHPDFDKCVRATEKLCKPLNKKIGETVGLSPGDIHAINKMYPFSRNDRSDPSDEKNITGTLPPNKEKRDRLSSASSLNFRNTSFNSICLIFGLYSSFM